MSWDLFGKLLLALSPVIVGAGIQYWPHGGRRSRIKADIELYNLLPEEMPHRDELKASIGAQLQKLIAHDTLKRRNMTNFVTGVVFLAVTGYQIYLARSGGWWWAILVVAVVTGFSGIALVVDGLTKNERDERGRLARNSRKTVDG